MSPMSTRWLRGIKDGSEGPSHYVMPDGGTTQYDILGDYPSVEPVVPQQTMAPSFSLAVAGAVPKISVVLDGDSTSLTESELAALTVGFLNKLQAESDETFKIRQDPDKYRAVRSGRAVVSRSYLGKGVVQAWIWCRCRRCPRDSCGASKMAAKPPSHYVLPDGAVVRLFYGCFLVIEARGGTWFRTPCPNCRAEPFKASASAPRPRKGGQFRVAMSDRPPSPPWDPRLPVIGTGARTSHYAFNTVRISDVRASRWGGVCE